MNLSNPASLTLAEIRDLLARGALRETDFDALDRDPRAGVRRLVTTYRRQQTLKEKADAERAQLLAHETRARTDGFVVVCGVDEAGRGPLAGPVVAAAVVFAPGEYIAGVRDSKALNPARREELYASILTQALDWSVGSADHEEIDRINILRATHLAMRRAIEGLRSAPPDLALIDGLPVKGLPCRHRAIIGGDASSFTIAAASILAKVTRDRVMDEYAREYPVYGFTRNKGYGTPEHLEALKRFGPCPIHRRSFTVTGASLFDFAY